VVLGELGPGKLMALTFLIGAKELQLNNFRQHLKLIEVLIRFINQRESKLEFGNESPN